MWTESGKKHAQHERATVQLNSDYSQKAAHVQSCWPGKSGANQIGPDSQESRPVSMVNIHGSVGRYQWAYGITGASMVTGSLMAVKAIEMFITMRRLASPTPSASPGRMKSMVIS